MSVLSHRVRRGAGPPRERLLAAVAALFAFDGAVFGSWAARIPDVTAQVGTSHTGLGLALLCVSIGALASMQAAGALAARLAAACAVLLCWPWSCPDSRTRCPRWRQRCSPSAPRRAR